MASIMIRGMLLGALADAGPGCIRVTAERWTPLAFGALALRRR